MKKILLYITVLTSFMVVGCSEDFIEKNPPLDLGDPDIYTDAARLESTLLGLYGTVKEGYFMGGKTYVAFDNRGDDIKNIGNNNVTLLETYEMKVMSTSSENDRCWYFAYLAINRANVFLAGMEEYNSVEVLGEALYKQYVAEAKAVRSLCYYYLTQLYSQPYVIDPNAKAVPLRIEAVTGPGASNCPRSSISTIYNQILTDLDNATVSALPAITEHNYDAVTRITQGAANMIKMRVYMAMENWTDAITAGEAITGYVLDDVTALFSAPYYTKESIFSLPHAETNVPNTQRGAVEYYVTGDICIIDTDNGVMSKSAYYLDKDKRISKYVDKPTKKLTKFNETSKLQWVPIFRYAETKLNLAECYYKANRIGDAQNALNEVRSRSIAPADDEIDVTTMTGAELLTAIENEKRLEFIGEGMRGIEILRKGGTYNKGNLVVPPTDNGYVWPMPEAERVLNQDIDK